ncbi:MAG: DNA methylase [Clostridiales bacterium]|nr:DNA methylase [Clostridiales bacterium]
MTEEKAYIAIDLKSFYASVECVERGLDPLTTHLVVADPSRTEKTICLAVSPSLKQYGIPGRARLFEVVQRVRQINAARLEQAPNRQFTGASFWEMELRQNPALELKYITAPPRMAHYMACSTRIYHIYCRFVAPEDIHVYSVDEVFIDASPYLKTYQCTPRELALRMVKAVLRETGITATAGIGTNLYLAKVAMDIVAKHIPPDRDGVRIAELDERRYREQLWGHTPLTDFWRVGRGYARKLEALGIRTMGDIARCSLGKSYSPYGQEKLFRLFGVNAELLIDHAWGVEPCTIADIKAYQPESHSLSSGQVLSTPYPADKARLVVREMTDNLALELIDKRLVTDQMVLVVGYDIENLSDPMRRAAYNGPVEADYYGRQTPKAAHGSVSLPRQTASSTLMMEAVAGLFDRIVHPALLVRRMYVVANHVVREDSAGAPAARQIDFWTDCAAEDARDAALDREKRRQRAVVALRKKYGKNAVLRGMNFEEGATARERNAQIGGHKA